MDDIVKQAIAKWPGVPNCHGWLGLDARGNWYMRDDRVQALGWFASGVPGCKGSLLQHDKLIAFIGRNYAADALGQWFFQNGPQRVYVELEATPLIWRVQPNLSLRDHIGRPARVQGGLVDEQGYLYLLTDTGFGLVHTQDVALAAEPIEQGLWQVQEVMQADLPNRYGYQKSPQLLYKK
jgi:hypothetical protein